MISNNNLNISLIVAMANNRVIGNDNKLLWHLPNDLKRFKAITMGKPIVMGRKTFESIGRVLPGRDNIVLTSDVNKIKNINNIDLDNNYLKIFNNIDTLLDNLKNNYNNTEIMIIGGGEIYKIFLNYANKIYLTIVDTDIDGDTYFPELNKSVWQEISNSKEMHYKDAKHQYDYIFIDYTK